MLSSDKKEEISMSDSSPNFMKPTSSSHAKESSQISQRMLRRKSLKRMSTLKLKRNLTIKIEFKTSRSIKLANFKGLRSTRQVKTRNKATCSSIIREEGEESEGVSTSKVCTYAYCSLHGHHHDNVISLKRVISTRKRLLKSQKNKKMERRSQFQNSKNLASDSSAETSRTSASTSAGGGTEKNKPNSKAIGTADTNIKDHEVAVSHEMEEERNLPLNLTNPESTGGGSNAHDLTNPSSHLFNESTEPNPNDLLESTFRSIATPSDSDMNTLEEGTKTKDKDTEPDSEVLKLSSPQEDSKPVFTTDTSYKMPETDNKYIKMWNLVYKHAVLSNSMRGEKKITFDKEDKEKQRKDVQAISDVDNSSSIDHYETDQDMDNEKEQAVELVQKAFDEILLPETKDLSPDDHIDTRGIATNQELSTREFSEEAAWLKVDNLINHEEETAAQRTGNKPQQKMPRSWSNVKKLILLKRFVNALEKVSKNYPYKNQQLTSDAKVEAEKAYLRRQTAEEKRNAEEWMLDYALQKVISKLAPAQKQRVALLIEAFETIVPYQETEDVPQSYATVSTQANAVQALKASSDHSEEETTGERNYGYSTVMKKEKNKSIIDDNSHVSKVDDFGLQNKSFSKPDDNISTSHEEAPSKETVKAISQGFILNSETEIPNSIFGLQVRDFDTKNPISAHGEQISTSKSLILKGLMKSLGSNLALSSAPSDLLNEPTEDRNESTEGTKQETETFPVIKESEADNGAAVVTKSHLEKQNNTSLWYMVYKHMVSGIAADDDSKPLVDVSNKEQSAHDASSMSATVTNEDTHTNYHGAHDPEVELPQTEAVKMIEEAIDEILPDVEEHSPDDHSQKRQGEKCGNRDGKDKEEEEEEEESVGRGGNKSKPKLSRSWSNLKKVIVLRRFVKALEKVRKVNYTRGSRDLPLEPDTEAEKVHLRRQDVEERKGAEEWMLDLALQQVVAKLTPARKRKVEMLVEAFETVMPAIRN